MRRRLTGVVAVLLALLLAFLLWTPDRDRASLEALYLQSPSDMVQVAGQRLHVRDSGPKDAPAILKALRGETDRLLCTTAASGSLRAVESLVEESSRAGIGAETAADPASALAKAVQLATIYGLIKMYELAPNVKAPNNPPLNLYLYRCGEGQRKR